MLSFLYSPTLTSIHDHWKNHSLMCQVVFKGGYSSSHVAVCVLLYSMTLLLLLSRSGVYFLPLEPGLTS